MSVKTVLACWLVAGACAAVLPDMYDNVNVDEIFANERLLAAYVNCLMERGKCTAQGKLFKERISEALQNGCDKCTETQLEKAQRVIEILITKYRVYWDELCGKYDPQGVWRKKYEDVARTRGIIIPQ